MKKLFLFIAILFTHSVSGLLPPFYESLKEYQALLSSPTLPEKLTSGEWIVDIKRQDDVFTIETLKNRLQVKVVYEKQQRIGPAAFHLEFGEVVPLSEVSTIERHTIGQPRERSRSPNTDS